MRRPSSPLLSVAGLEVRFGDDDPAVRGVDLEVRAGQTVAIVGESGSGKSTTAAAILGLLPPGGRITAGRIEFDGVDLTAANRRQLRAVRGSGIGYVPQDPMTNLNPVWRIGFQVREALRANSIDRPCGPAAGRCRSARAGPASPAVSASAVRRNVSTRADRHRAGRPATATDRRRADVGAGRHRAAPRARSSAAARRRTGYRGAADHPRSGAGRRTGRTAGRDEPGSGGGNRCSADDSARPAACLHAATGGGGAVAACWLPPRAGSSPRTRRT